MVISIDHGGWLGANGECFGCPKEALASLRQYREQIYPGIPAAAPAEVWDSSETSRGPTIVPIVDQFIAPATAVIVEVTRYVNERLWADLCKTPGLVQSIRPRELEELTAELFAREGFQVELTPAVRDGGRDLIAIRSDAFGSVKYIVECKRYRPDRKVGVELVRSIYGLLEDDEATCGLLVTTSSFTKGAKAFAKRHEWRVSLKDFRSLVEWLERHSS